jgi:hypothetical protein
MEDVTKEEKAITDKKLHDMELNNLCAWSNIITSDSTENYG